MPLPPTLRRLARPNRPWSSRIPPEMMPVEIFHDNALQHVRLLATTYAKGSTMCVWSRIADGQQIVSPCVYHRKIDDVAGLMALRYLPPIGTNIRVRRSGLKRDDTDRWLDARVVANTRDSGSMIRFLSRRSSGNNVSLPILVAPNKATVIRILYDSMPLEHDSVDGFWTYDMSPGYVYDAAAEEAFAAEAATRDRRASYWSRMHGMRASRASSNLRRASPTAPPPPPVEKPPSPPATRITPTGKRRLSTPDDPF